MVTFKCIFSTVTNLVSFNPNYLFHTCAPTITSVFPDTNCSSLFHQYLPFMPLSLYISCSRLICTGACAQRSVCRCRPACLIPVVTCWLPVKSIFLFFLFSMFRGRTSVISSCLHQFPFCYLQDALLTPRSCLLILHIFMSSTLKPVWKKQI